MGHGSLFSLKLGGGLWHAVAMCVWVNLGPQFVASKIGKKTIFETTPVNQNLQIIYWLMILI